MDDKYAFDEERMLASIARFRASKSRYQALPPKKGSTRAQDAGAPTSAGIVQVILDHVARSYGVTIEQLRGECREVEFTRPRHLAMLLMRDNAGMSQARIGEEFNRSQHATMHGIHQAERRLEDDVRMQGIAALCPFPVETATAEERAA